MPIDPFKPLEGGLLHKADIAIAELATGVPGKSISRHAIAPAVARGVPEPTALARFHWLCLGVAATAVAAVVAIRRS